MEKSWETLSDSVILAGGSLALGRFGRLFPSGEDNVKEGESLLLMFLGFHSFCYDTTHTFSKLIRISTQEGACLQTIYLGMFICLGFDLQGYWHCAPPA